MIMKPIPMDHHSNTHFCGVPIALYLASSSHPKNTKPAKRGMFACRSCKGRLVTAIARLIIYDWAPISNLSTATCSSSSFPSPEVNTRLRRTLGLDSFPALMSIDRLWRKLLQHIGRETALSLEDAQAQSTAQSHLKALFGDVVSEAGTQGFWEQDDGTTAWTWFKASLKRRQDDKKEKNDNDNDNDNNNNGNNNFPPSAPITPNETKLSESISHRTTSANINNKDNFNKTATSDDDLLDSIGRNLSTLLGSLELRVEAEKAEVEAQQAWTLALANSHNAAGKRRAGDDFSAAKSAVSNEKEKTEDLARSLIGRANRLDIQE